MADTDVTTKSIENLYDIQKVYNIAKDGIISNVLQEKKTINIHKNYI